MTALREIIHQGKFKLTCTQCRRNSESVPIEDVQGKSISDVVASLGFIIVSNDKGGGYVFCSHGCEGDWLTSDAYDGA